MNKYITLEWLSKLEENFLGEDKNYHNILLNGTSRCRELIKAAKLGALFQEHKVDHLILDLAIRGAMSRVALLTLCSNKTPFEKDDIDKRLDSFLAALKGIGHEPN